MLFNIEVVIYSLIYGVVYSIACDRVHIQNINMSVMIFTKKLGISRAIMEQLGRGVANWDGAGAYTNQASYILFVVISKYEVNQLKRVARSIDLNAFMIFTEGCSVSGNFEKSGCIYNGYSHFFMPRFDIPPALLHLPAVCDMFSVISSL